MKNELNLNVNEKKYQMLNKKYRNIINSSISDFNFQQTETKMTKRLTNHMNKK